MPPKAVPNGSAEAPIEIAPLPPVVGINFGNSYASIAVFTKDGLAECIANEDGERQIACAISFFGEEIYIGNQATHQLVKNSQNTITGFRNLIGLKFSQIPQNTSTKSAPVIQHPDIPDEPAYKVQILQPAPTPLPQNGSNFPSAYTTPAASHAPTPRSEPTPAERILTVSEVASLFLASLVESAQDFLGTPIRGAVLTVPSNFTSAQRDGLEKAAEDAGVHVLQILDEPAAAAAVTTDPLWSPDLNPDRTQLIVDLGASALSVSVITLRAGLAHLLATTTTSAVSGTQIDDILIAFFAADFTKKTKTPLALSSSNTHDQRAEARLRLAIEHTKRTISASPGAATCSVESLKDGFDYTGSINRMRFDTIVRPVYAAVATAISALLTSAALDPAHIDEIVYLGGAASLPGLDDHLCLASPLGLPQDLPTPFARGTVVGGGVGDPTTILARGCAVQAALIAAIPEDDAQLRAAYERGADAHHDVRTLQRTVGVLFPDPSADSDMGGLWVPVVLHDTPLPARRSVVLDVALPEASTKKRFAFEVWEVSETVRVDKVVLPRPDDDDDDDDEYEEEEEEVRHRIVTKEVLLGVVDAEALLGIKAKGKGKDAGKWTTVLEVQFVVDAAGGLAVDAKEVGVGGAKAGLSVPPPSSS